MCTLPLLMFDSLFAHSSHQSWYNPRTPLTTYFASWIQVCSGCGKPYVRGLLLIFCANPVVVSYYLLAISFMHPVSLSTQAAMSAQNKPCHTVSSVGLLPMPIYCTTLQIAAEAYSLLMHTVFQIQVVPFVMLHFEKPIQAILQAHHCCCVIAC